MAKSPTRKKRGPGRPPRSEKLHTRQDITIAAETCFAETGYRATSLRQIAAQTGVDLATVKYHFPEKSELYNAAFSLGNKRYLEHFYPIIEDIGNAGDRDALAIALQRLASEYVDYIHQDQQFARLMIFRILEGVSRPPQVNNDYRDEIVAQIERGIQQAIPTGLADALDLPALMAFLRISVPLWVLTAETQPEYLGTSDASGTLSIPRAKELVGELLSRVIT